MSMIERLAAWAGFQKIENSGIPITEYTRGSEAWNDMFGPYVGTSLPAPTRYTAMTSTAIHACTSLISGAIMAMPVNVYKVDIKTGERDRIFDDALGWVFNEEMSARWPSSIGWEYLCLSLLFEGDGFAKIKRDRMSRPIGLEPWHPWLVQNAPTDDGARMVYRFSPQIINGVTIGKVEILDQDDVLHIPGFGFDGWRGLTPLRHSLRNAGAVALATQEYAGNFFANSARPDYVLQSDLNIGEQLRKEMQKLIDERHRNPANAHRPMVLGGGLKIEPWSISPSDLQLLSTRQFQIEEICRAYGVPPFMVGHTEKNTSWGAGVESMGKGFVRYTLRQYLHKFEVELNRKLFRTAARVCEFDTADLERADTATLMTALRTGVGRAGEPRIMSIDEARAVLRLKKDPSGDGALLGINPGKPLPADDKGDSNEKPAS